MSATMKLSKMTVLTNSDSSKVENEATINIACHHFIFKLESGLEMSIVGSSSKELLHSYYSEGPTMSIDPVLYA